MIFRLVKSVGAMADDGKLCQLASTFLGKSYSHGMGGFGGAPGDLVQRENDRAQIKGIERLLDVEVFRQLLSEALEGKPSTLDKKPPSGGSWPHGRGAMQERIDLVIGFPGPTTNRLAQFPRPMSG